MLAALHAASEKKALEPVVLDLREIASFTDYFVIVSGANERQVQAISDEIYESLKKSGHAAARVEGYKTAEWILLDYGDFVVHVFEQKARKFYDLERLWRESKRIEVPAVQLRQCWFFEKRIVIELFARSPRMREAISLAERVSATDANVLITGESGVGKDLLAFHSFKISSLGAAVVKIDCATLPGELLEAELFGFERGAFTGAVETKAGRFEAAQKGTIVLDEIAHLSTDAQAKLLRVIERREFERLGGRRTIKLDARLIALTNVDLDAAVKIGRFEKIFFIV